MSRQTIKRTAKVCFDIFLFLCVCFAEFAIHKWWTPYRRGFFCGDESLSYPFRESTIGLTALGLISFFVPTLVILAVELFKHLEPAACLISTTSMKRQKKLSANGVAAAAATNGNIVTSMLTTTAASSSSSAGCRLGHRLLQCYKQIGYYVFGLALILVATEIPKFAVGRLRPNFFTICQPQLNDGSTCDDDVNQGRYITDYTCLMVGQNFTASQVKQVNQSFPSGHTSILFYAMLYLSIYLQAALSTRASKLLKHLLQFVFMMFALWVALTRVSDYWHHWSDVLAGAVLGSIMAIVVAIFMTDLFDCQRRRRWWLSGGNGAYKTTQLHHPHHHQRGNSSSSSTAKSAAANAAAVAALPAYTFGTLPYVHYTPHHHQQPQHYGHATYQNYGYVP